jgi:DNA modification methylase
MNALCPNASLEILQGDVIEQLKTLPDASVHCVVTSPPYYGLRDYKVPPSIWGGNPQCQHDWQGAPPRRLRKIGDVKNPESKQATNRSSIHDLRGTDFCGRCGAWRGCLGFEPTPELFVRHLVAVFREVRRVLHPSGTVWLNLGDSFAGGKGRSGQADSEIQAARAERGESINRAHHQIGGKKQTRPTDDRAMLRASGLKPKDLIGIPWRVAFALQADGWWLRSEIIWAKGISCCAEYSGSCMPESVTDRPTKGHEYVFLLTKKANYFYDAQAVREDANYDGRKDTYFKGGRKHSNGYAPTDNPNTMSLVGHERWKFNEEGDRVRNLRSVWAINPEPFYGAHFATFPTKLVKICVLAGTSAKGCCPLCRAPWARVTGNPRRVLSGGYGSKTADEVGLSPTGWKATCKCQANKNGSAETMPCVVLDPFGGSGTTGQVALELGRSAVLIELNGEYVKLARQRCAVTGGLALA